MEKEKIDDLVKRILEESDKEKDYFSKKEGEEYIDLLRRGPPLLPNGNIDHFKYMKILDTHLGRIRITLNKYKGVISKEDRLNIDHSLNMLFCLYDSPVGGCKEKNMMNNEKSDRKENKYNNIYEKNGLIFWTEEEIKFRSFLEEYFSSRILNSFKRQNSAFQMVRVEAPLLTPAHLINKNYTSDDVFSVQDGLVLRPETTMGTYKYIEELLNPHNEIGYKLPLIVWQHGKSFRNEQDQPTKFMRLKEFYQLEFQAVYALNTKNNYTNNLYDDLLYSMNSIIGKCRLEESDRLPDYSEETMDIICNHTNMEVCSISKRKDFEGFKVLEIAIGTDRCIYNFYNKL